ncbi:zinc finger CCCH domain-containing protein 24 isoform X1 [Ricinus communis]|uniref:zinc finger CCCH domain-containing protein 24 isoform X1 n=1 Tax=Ricinus communis TaxID=3988 RepID=UPI00201B1D0D|nr:zinc finger CCCH domain-containing protein 24 isoform X1 [Ricinus communis]
MASSPPINKVSPTETLNPSSITEISKPMSPQSPETTIAATADDNNNNGNESNNQGEKRKREETEEQQSETEEKSELSHNPYYKTSLCSYFRRHSASCSHGSECKYAHGEEELRQRPDNTWDPTSERAKKAIKLEKNSDNCDVKEEKEEIMMTEMIGDDDGDGAGGEGGGCLDPELSKCLVHLPRKWNSDNFKNFLNEQGVLFKWAKKKKGMVVGFVTFETADQLKKASEGLEGKSVGNKKVKVADVIPRSYDKNIKSAMALPHNNSQKMESLLDGENADVIEDGDRSNGASKFDSSTSKAKSACEVVTPLAHMSYEDQLEHKKNSIMQMLKKLTRNARKACPNGVSLPEWVLKSREIGGLACSLEGILESPLVNGYRNKCEFSVGYSLQGKPIVGFMLGNFRDGVTAVEEPMDCPNVSSIASKYALIFQEFLQESGLPIWNRFKNTGFWRQLTVREGRLPEKDADIKGDVNMSEIMLIVQVCLAGFDDELINSELWRLAHAFTTGAAANSPPLPLKVLVLQDHQGISNVAPADAPLRILPLPNVESSSEAEATKNVVEARIHDHINNLRFSISPTAFFQVNTLAAERLYSLAGDWAGLGPDTLLFDICCGTGTIGLTLAHRVGMVVGIEMNASAVSDAHRNAEINGIRNCRFICAKAESVMASLLKEYLNEPQKQDEVSYAGETSDKDLTACEDKDTPVGNVVDTTENSSHELGNGKSDSRCSEDGEQEHQIHPQDSCASKDGTYSVPQFKNVVAIVDPPRNGLHPTVIKALRTHSHLRRLVYISCNPETLVANAIELCTPSPDKIEKGKKNNRGWRNMSSAGLARHRAQSMPISEPFRPVKAMAVDLFPHTTHCEMVMLLER